MPRIVQEVPAGVERSRVAGAIQCLTGSLAAEASLGITFRQGARPSGLLLQSVSERKSEIAGLFTLK